MTEHIHSNRKKVEKQPGKSWSIYSTCDELPLRLFIDVYTGNKRALIKKGDVPENELSFTANKIILEYVGIIQSKGVSFEIQSRNNLMNYTIKIYSLEAAELLITVGRFEEATDVLKPFRIKKNLTVTEENVESVRRIIASEIALTKMLSDRLAKRVQTEKREEKPSKKKFYAEIAMVSQHFKMPIDLDIPASIYANYVKNMLHEIKEIRNGKNFNNR